jgi:putative ABC transport system permease protein
MMKMLVIGLRNIRRNMRRSVTTILAIAIGALAMLAFGGFMAFLVVGFRTQVIEGTGHLAVMKKGFYEFGSGNPAAYGIADYQGVIAAISDDKTLGPMINVITPTITMYGLAANFDADSSRTFYGFGVVPSDRQKMRAWDEAGITKGRVLDELGLVDEDDQRGVIGTGLARILGLCQPLKIADCFAAPARHAVPAEPQVKPGESTLPPGLDLSELARRDTQAVQASPDAGMPRIDLLSATSGGSPNIVSLYVAKARTQGARELDDVYVAMNLSLAQQLLYGRGEHKATSLVIQLHHYADMGPARRALGALIAAKGLDLEVHDFTELTPQYNQVIGFFGAIFVFIALVMGVIVLFTVANTMTMAVMERTNEIGTTRALGVRRSGIRRQFLVEGALLGVIGAALGLLSTELVAVLLNHSGLRWTPPGQAYAIPLRLLMSGIGPLIVIVMVALIVIAIVAALMPANRAARMPVVDSLRHV